MSAWTAASVEDAANNLLEELNSGAMRLCVEHDASDDVAPALLRAARARVEAGSNVRVVCADAVAAARFRALAADDPLLGALDVVSVRELALSILGDARVGDAVGRDARVLDENELAVLMEDVKVSGLKPGRLREMLKFFYKSISDCADDDERWLITAEEQTVHAILTENLEARRALLPCEVSSLAYRGLVKAEVEREPLTLVADDFGSLSKASQRLVRHLATDGLVAAGRTLASSSSEEPYPCFDGFRALADEADCLVTLACERPAAARESRALDDPAAEFAFAAASVGSAWSMASGQATWLWPCRTPLGASASRLSWKGAASPWSAGSTAGRSRATRAPRAVTPTSSWPRSCGCTSIRTISRRCARGWGSAIGCCAPMRFWS